MQVQRVTTELRIHKLMVKIVLALVLVAVFVIFPILMVRGLIDMYRDKNRSGTFTGAIGGMMTELDRAIRPSTQHVAEAKESSNKRDDEIGGE